MQTVDVQLFGYEPIPLSEAKPVKSARANAAASREEVAAKKVEKLGKVRVHARLGD